jgi:hypothetical protein
MLASHILARGGIFGWEALELRATRLTGERGVWQSRRMNVPASLIESLSSMPQQFERAFRLVPRSRLNWKPESWDGIPGETFSALEQACHLRDIEVDGYHLRIRRMLEESDPTLPSIDSYELARERRYAEADAAQVIAAFGVARGATISMLTRVRSEHLERTGTFEGYGRLTLRGLIHYLCSHDQQHLACMQWLLGKMSNR